MTKPRKGVKYQASIETLLRDAQPLRSEIEGEIDKEKRVERERMRDIAIDDLLEINGEIEKRGGPTNPLEFQVSELFKRLKEAHGGDLPRRKGGRPVDLHRKLSIAVATLQSIEGAAGMRGKLGCIFKDVARRFNIRARTVKDIHYDRDPKWMKLLATELARRSFESRDVVSLEPPEE